MTYNLGTFTKKENILLAHTQVCSKLQNTLTIKYKIKTNKRKILLFLFEIICDLIGVEERGEGAPETIPIITIDIRGQSRILRPYFRTMARLKFQYFTNKILECPIILKN